MKPKEFEEKWRSYWEKNRVYQPDMESASQPFYNLMMFPYPSAEGLHVGNMYAFTGADIYGRFQRMLGKDVFEPMGLDGFGIHSENYAIKIGKHPVEQSGVSEKNFYRQLSSIGNAFAWENKVETYDPNYYKWTQWIFVQMFKHGLAYRKKSPVNFCPSCKTVLSDEQVIEGQCERCNSVVEKRELEQWFFRITNYAERLLSNLDKIDWANKVKIVQRSWIGKKEGINITYPVVDGKGVIAPFARGPLANGVTITCFTTRPDTNFGATFIVLAPEHPFVATLISSNLSNLTNLSKLKDYVSQTKKTSETERIAQGRKKTGIFTGFYAVNHLTERKMPIYISDFVIGTVGTGAVVGVPGHDLRDFEFAKEFNIPVVRVVVGKDGDQSAITKQDEVQEEEGTMINSGFLDGMDIHLATEKMMDHLEEKRWGKRVVSYHLRDWLISRQRYWGPPIPMIFCSNCASNGKSWFTSTEASSKSKVKNQKSKTNEKIGNWKLEIENSAHEMSGWYPVPESDLPVKLPYVKDFKPLGTGVSPLAQDTEFVNVACPECGSPARRETDVSDTFLDSAWYFLRYPSTKLDQFVKLDKLDPSARDTPDTRATRGTLPWNPEVTRHWLPVDIYIGGAEHSVLHLLYSRFVTMAFRDWGLIDFEEPFTRFYAHGLIIKDGAKMSKSKGNVVVPDDYIKTYGSDTLRTYLMFLGPFHHGGDFRDSGIEGMYRFLNRVWRLVSDYLERVPRVLSVPRVPQAHDTPDTHDTLLRVMHRTIKEVTEDMPALRYNTAIAHIMEYVNEISNVKTPSKISDEILQGKQISNLPKEIFENLLLLLAPFSPFMTEELWFRLSQFDQLVKLDQYPSIHQVAWPKYNPKYLEEETVTIAVQVNGRLRDTFQVESSKCKVQSEIEEIARRSPKVQKYLDGQTVKKVIFVPGRLLNFVV